MYTRYQEITAILDISDRKEGGVMIGAVGASDTAVYFRKVDAIAAVGAREIAQKREAGVVDSEGRPLSGGPRASEAALSREKRDLLARLRGERGALEDELMRAWTNAAHDAETPNQTPDAQGDGAGPSDLTEAEQAQVEKLKARDREVRAHEQAHAAVGGQYAGAPSYSYQTGPDGRSYAIGGEVAIDVSAVPGDPAATIDKMRTVQAAALAPAEPSAQDRRVAQQAQAQMQEAMGEARSERAAELSAATAENAPPAAAIYEIGRAALSEETKPQLNLAA